RIRKLGGGEARKQTEPPDNALKKYAALLCWQVASGGHDGGKLGVAQGEHWRQNHSWPILRYGVLCLTAVNSFWFPLSGPILIGLPRRTREAAGRIAADHYRSEVYTRM